MFVAALLLRVAVAWILRGARLSGDEVSYDAVAWHLASGQGFSLERGSPTAFVFPGFPFFLGLVYFLFGHSLLAARVAQALLSASICVLIYKLSETLFHSRKIARLSSLLSVFYPSFVSETGRLGNDLLVTLFLLFSLYFLLQAVERKERGFFVAAGLSLGLLVLTRGEYLLLFVLVGGWVFRLSSSFREAARQYGIVAITVGLLAAPWVARNDVVFHHFPLFSTRAGVTLYNSYFLSEKGFGFNQVQGVRKELAKLPGEVAQDRFFAGEAFQFIREHPGTFLKLVPVKIALVFYPFDGRWHRINLLSKYNLLFGLVLCFGLFGFVSLLKKKEKKSFLLFLPFVQTGFVAAIFYGKPLYRLPLEPLLIALAAKGFLVVQSFQKKKGVVLSAGILFLNLGLFFFADFITDKLSGLMQLLISHLPKG